MDTTRGSLLLRLRSHADTRAWSEFDALYRPILQSYAIARGVPEDSAEDLVQQCLVAVSQKIHDFEYDRGKGRFRTWLLTIIERRIIDLLRKQEPIIADSGWINSLQAKESSPEEVFERIWTVQHLRILLEQVRLEVEESTFEAFRLYVLESMPAEQVCDAMGMNRNQLYTIKWRIMRMIEKRFEELE